MIASSAYVFSSASAAHSGFSTMAAGFSKRGAKLYGSAFGPHSVSGLGAEQRAWTWPCDGTSCPKGSTEAFVFARPGRVAWGVNVMSAGGRSTVFSTTLGYARKQKARVGGG